jgi:hypothetical protein
LSFNCSFTGCFFSHVKIFIFMQSDFKTFSFNGLGVYSQLENLSACPDNKGRDSPMFSSGTYIVLLFMCKFLIYLEFILYMF